jgi:hypothetical protein
MEYFNTICNIIITILGIFGLSLFLFVVIRDNFYKNDKSNSNKGADNSRGHEDLW